jgi:hypothetical protein
VFAMMLIAITVLVTVLPYSQVNIWVWSFLHIFMCLLLRFSLFVDKILMLTFRQAMLLSEDFVGNEASGHAQNPKPRGENRILVPRSRHDVKGHAWHDALVIDTWYRRYRMIFSRIITWKYMKNADFSLRKSG